MYIDTESPRTFESMSEEVWPDSEEKPRNKKFVRSVIYIAIKEVLGAEKMAEINKWRDTYYAGKLRETIAANGGQKMIDKIRFL